MKKSILAAFVLFLIPFSNAGAVVGTAEMNLNFDGPFGLKYAAENQDAIHGEFSQNGTLKPAALKKNSKNQWVGRLGRYLITAYPPFVSVDGAQMTIHIASVPGGFFDYTITRDSSGNIQMRGLVGSGRSLQAGLSENGVNFSVQGTHFVYGVRENLRSLGNYSGSILSRDGRGGSAAMTLGGSLFFPRLFSEDPTLFTVLFVLPFHEAQWPAY